MSSWQKVRLGDVGRIVTGKTPKTSVEANFGNDIPFLTPSDNMDERYCLSTKRMLSSLGAASVKNCILPSNAVCVSCIGSDLGKVVKTTQPTVTNQQINSIVVNEDYDSSFVYYALKILGRKLNFISKTSTAVPIVNKTSFSNFEINLPPLEEQERIAKMLGSLDDKIELNNKINRNLEAQAEALFKQWFVDFDFPDPSGNPYRTSGGAMIDSPLGTIPEGWRVKSAEDIFNISIGKTPPRKEQHWFTKNKSDVKWVSIADMGKSGTFINDSSEYLTDEAVQKYNVAIVPNNTVILSFKLTIGRVAITDGAITTNEAIAHFKTANEDIVEYLYLNLKQYNYESLGNTSSIATAVNSKTIKSMKLILPSNEVLTAFSLVTTPIFEMLKKNNKQTQVLTYLRDSLLPKLMNNEINL